MNKSGIASIYALYLLNIVVVVSLLLLQMAISTAISHQSDDLFATELIAIYRIKARLKELEQIPATEIVEEDEDNEEQEKEAGFSVSEENITHGSYTAIIHYHDQGAEVWIDELHFEVLCDLSASVILDLVYLS